MKYSKKFKKDMLSKKELYHILKHKGKTNKIDDNDKMTMLYLRETESKEMIQKLCKEVYESRDRDYLKNYLKKVRNTMSFNCWMMSRAMKVVKTIINDRCSKGIV